MECLHRIETDEPLQPLFSPEFNLRLMVALEVGVRAAPAAGVSRWGLQSRP